ncbi:MAG: hypothetical protein ABTQ93_06430 [Candidatus Competibacter denitrificans]
MKIYLSFLGIIFSAISLNAFAESFSWGNVIFQPRAYVGYADFTLKASEFADFTYQNPIDGSQNKKESWVLALPSVHKLQLHGPLLGIGGTVAIGSFFGDVYYQSTQNEETGDSSLEEDALFKTNYNSPKLEHKDWAFSLGYLLTEQWSIFVGYKSGDTEWRQTVQYTSPQVATYSGNRNIGGKFEQEGPFIGTAYSWPVGPGLVTIRAAYAYLDGKDQEYSDFIDSDGVSESSAWHLDGNSDAYAIGLSWTQNMTENLGYSIGVNYHNYEFEMSGGIAQNLKAGTTRATLKNISMTEELLTLSASVIYRF